MRRNNRLLPALFGAAGIAVLLTLWQWGSTQVTNERALPSLPAVASALGGSLADPTVWVAIAQTIGLALLGWAIGGVLGIAIGVLVGTSDIASSATRAVFDFLRPIPAIVILPLALLLFGPTPQLGLFLIVFGIFLPVAAQTAAGVLSCDPVARDTARSFGMSRMEILWRVVIPGTTPYIGTAMRVTAPVALVMIVVAGMLGGAPGIGNLFTIAQYAGRYVDLFAYVVILGALGLLLQVATTRTERALLHWHTSYRKELR
jgi:ABC-type nitrate/sulfonate/bicarbonate transport system permease component